MTPKVLQQRLTRHIKAFRNVMIFGMPGVGKSEIVEAAAKAAGFDLMLIHAVTSDPVDAKGMPMTYTDELTGEPVADFVPFGDLRRMIDADKPLVVFLDDFGQAPMAVQAAWMQILLARRLNGYKISDHVTFVAATNRREDKAGVAGIIEPVKSRFPVKVLLEPDVGEWCEWAIHQPDVHPVTVAFARFTHSKGDPLFVFKPTRDMEDSCLPRTLTFAGRMLNEDQDIPFEELTGCVGSAQGAKLAAFVKTWKELPDPDSVFLRPDSIEIPEKPDILYALIGAVAHRTRPDNVEAALKFVKRVPREFGVVLLKDCTSRDPAITKTGAFVKWAVENQDLLF